MKFGRHLRSEFLIEPALTYLNHPTVGATPRRVLAAQHAIQEEAERQPSQFELRELTAIRAGRAVHEKPLLRTAADAVGAFVGASGDDIVFVDNTTSGVNAILRSFPLQAGDEIVISELAYGGVMNAARYAARERGASVVVVRAPDSATSASLADSFEAAVTARTRIAIVDHISAQSALVWPVADLAARLRRRGVLVLCDGAHVPGALRLDVSSLGVDWYVANLHKSAFVPRSSAFLWAARERQAGLHPTVISWGLDRGFTMEFDLVGTRDASAHLAAPAAFAFIDSFGLDAILEHNHALAWKGAHLLAERWGISFDLPEALVGTMATLTLPAAFGSTAEDATKLRDELLFDEKIEVAVHSWRGRVQMRVAAQIYNDLDDYEKLAAAVTARARSATMPR